MAGKKEKIVYKGTYHQGNQITEDELRKIGNIHPPGKKGVSRLG